MRLHGIHSGFEFYYRGEPDIILTRVGFTEHDGKHFMVAHSNALGNFGNLVLIDVDSWPEDLIPVNRDFLRLANPLGVRIKKWFVEVLRFMRGYREN